MSLVDCLTFPEIQLKADAVWEENRTKVDETANVESALFVIKNTTATLTPITGEKDRDLKITWLNMCDMGTQDCTSDCDFDADIEAAGNCENYKIEQCKEAKPFKVALKDLRNKDYNAEMITALGWNRQDKALSEWIALQSIAAIEANKGVNVYDSPQGVVVGTETLITQAQWNMNLMGYLSLVQKKNKFDNASLLSGTNLYQAFLNAGWDAGNSEGKGAAARTSVFPITFDIFNVDAENDPDFKTYMMQRGALAFASKTYFGQYGVANMYDRENDGKVWTTDSKYLPGVKIERYYKRVCENNEDYLIFKARVYYDFFANPLGCNATNTGILSFKCGTAA